MTAESPRVGDTITTAEDLYDLFADGIEYVVVAAGWQPWLVTSTEDGDIVAWTWADEDTPTDKWPVRVVEKLPYPLTLMSFPPGGAEWAAGRAEARNVSHIGRSFHGTRLEDDCPCPKGPCGLATHDGTDHGCDQHDLGAARTIRQMHSAADCPAAGRAETTTATDDDAAQVIAAHTPTLVHEGPNGEDDGQHLYCNECGVLPINGLGLQYGPEHVTEQLRARGLLATARTRPTEDVPLLEDEDAARVLAEHTQLPRDDGGAECECGGWRGPWSGQEHERHVAQALADAGLLATARTRPAEGEATDLDRLTATLILCGIWDASVPPGGAVCPWCGDPWESEQSCEHAQAVISHNDRVSADALDDAAEDRELDNIMGKPYARLYDAKWLRERAARLRAGEQP